MQQMNVNEVWHTYAYMVAMQRTHVVEGLKSRVWLGLLAHTCLASAGEIVDCAESQPGNYLLARDFSWIGGIVATPRLTDQISAEFEAA